MMSLHRLNILMAYLLGEDWLVGDDEGVRDEIDVLIVDVAENSSYLVLSKCRIYGVDNQNEFNFCVCHISEAA